MPRDRQEGLGKLLKDNATPEKQEKLLLMMQDVLEKTKAKLDGTDK
eukprot:SAG25_NODE_5034_length_711_cov_0.671569_2_plen_46_part_00